MQMTAIQDEDSKYLMHAYGRFPAALVKGKNATAWDVNGKKYIDFTAGIGVNCLGYSDPQWVAAVTGQAAQIQHISNLYYSPIPSVRRSNYVQRVAWHGCFLATAAQRQMNVPSKPQESTAPINTGRNAVKLLP